MNFYQSVEREYSAINRLPPNQRALMLGAIKRIKETEEILRSMEFEDQ